MHKFLVVYASATGNAAECAAEIGFQLSRYRLHNESIALQDLNLASLLSGDRGSIVVFIVSTAGQGSFPLPAQKFWKGLQNTSLPLTSLESLSFALFGLGDSRYQQYNSAGIRLRSRLLDLGAKEICPVGLGDEQAELRHYGELDAWTSQLLLPACLKECNIKDSTPLPNNHVLPSRYVCTIGSHSNYEGNPVYFDSPRGLTKSNSLISFGGEMLENRTEVHSERVSGKFALPVRPRHQLSSFHRSPSAQDFTEDDSRQSGWFVAKIVDNDSLTERYAVTSVRHLTISVPVPCELRGGSPEDLYRAGDVLEIMPQCSAVKVREFCQALKFEPSDLLEIKDLENQETFDEMTIFELFSSVLDICQRPSRNLLRMIAQFSSNDEGHKSKLEDFFDPSCVNQYIDYVVVEKRSLYDVVIDFCTGITSRIPIQCIISYLPRIRPRMYSIASAPTWHIYKYNHRAICSRAAQASLLIASSRFVLSHLLAKSVTRSIEPGTVSRLCTNPRLISDWPGASMDLHIDLCVAEAVSGTPFGRAVGGLCSGFVSRLSCGSPFWARLSRFDNQSYSKLLTIANRSPAIFVSPGTGIAPARALIQQRFLTHWRLQHKALANDLVFLGFRDSNLDFLFKDEWTSLLKPIDEGAESVGEKSDGEKSSCETRSRRRRLSYHFRPQSDLFVAFSRADPSKPKEYVQEKIEQNSSLVYDVLVNNRNGILFVSGKSHPMPYQVVDAVKAAVAAADAQRGLFKTDQAKIDRFIKRMAAENRIIFDTW